MPTPFQVVCVGVVTIDALALVDRYPTADERVVGDQVSIVGGGPAANAAVVLARQGISVAFVGRVGADLEGEQALRLLELEGVDVSGVMRDQGVPTQASCVVVSKETQTRSISTLAVPPLPSLAEMGSRAVELVAAAEWVHTDHLGFGPVAELLGTMSPSTRPRLAVDAGNPVDGLDISLLDLYVPTGESLAAQYGQLATTEGVEKAAGLALADGARAVVATSGSEGSTAWWSAAFAPGTSPGRVHVQATTGIEIVSTLGAGDVFHGALLSAICRGLDWPQALRQANDTAALSCRALDGRSAVPTLAELITPRQPATYADRATRQPLAQTHTGDLKMTPAPTLNTMPACTLQDIARPSGGFAMLAVDQREALRQMFKGAGATTPVSDQTLTDFKVLAAQIISPYASGVLVDRQFSYDAVLAAGAVDPSCGLIVAADDFLPGNGIPVDSVQIDRAIDPAAVRAAGAKALKLLVLWRSDESAQQRMTMVAEFSEMCRSAGLVSIIEPVVRPPRRGADFDREAAILAAATELGDSGIDLYKGEMPYGAKADDKTLFDACRRLDGQLNMPWVILSSGVDADIFGKAVHVAVSAGASGFLSGRAIWASVVGATDPATMLRDVSVPRLKRLGEIVDESMAAR